MTDITTQDWADHCSGNSLELHRPADPGDFRFDIIAHDEPELGCTHTVVCIDDKGHEMERFTTDNPYGAVEAAREAQAYSLEERMDMEFQRECQERAGW